MRMWHLSLKSISVTHVVSFRRKSDIENERLPPELFDADSEEGKAILSSSIPATPSEHDSSQRAGGVSPNGVAEGLEKVISGKSTPLSQINTAAGSSASPGSPSGSPSPGGTFKRGHSRQASLGTTMTSPSTRRRSIESTMSLIQGVLEGSKIEEEVESLTSKMAGSSVGGQGQATR